MFCLAEGLEARSRMHFCACRLLRVTTWNQPKERVQSPNQLFHMFLYYVSLICVSMFLMDFLVFNDCAWWVPCLKRGWEAHHWKPPLCFQPYERKFQRLFVQWPIPPAMDRFLDVSSQEWCGICMILMGLYGFIWVYDVCAVCGCWFFWMFLFFQTAHCILDWPISLKKTVDLVLRCA